MVSTVVSIRLEDGDRDLVTHYAEVFGMTISEFMREKSLEFIEDELDIKAYEEAMKEFKANPVTYTSEEVEAMFL